MSSQGQFVMSPDNRWTAALKSGSSISEIARRENVSDSLIRARAQLACLSPGLQCAILDGMQPAEPTVELDVRASHLAILYGLNGRCLDTQADPYHIEGIERDVVKLLFTAWCGNGKPPVR